MKITNSQTKRAFAIFAGKTANLYAKGDGEAIDKRARAIRAENIRRTAA